MRKIPYFQKKERKKESISQFRRSIHAQKGLCFLLKMKDGRKKKPKQTIIIIIIIIEKSRSGLSHP